MIKLYKKNVGSRKELLGDFRMADTLNVSDMLPNKFEPKRKFRWVFAIEGIDAFLMKSAARPTMNTGEMEIPFINSTQT